MKVLKRQEFLALGHHAVFAKLKKNVIGTGQLCVFLGAVDDNDFVLTKIGVNFETSDCNELHDKPEDMRAQKAEYFYSDEEITRDGLFESEEDVKFVVFDKLDLAKLIAQLDNIYQQTPLRGADPCAATGGPAPYVG